MTDLASSRQPDAQAGFMAAPAEPPDHPRPLNSTSADTRLTIVGSLVGSLAVVWLLYTQILPFSGVVGFVICWYVAYIAMFAIVTALVHSGPIVADRLWTAAITGAAGLVGVALVSTLVYTVVQGWPAVRHLNFVTQSMTAAPTAPLDQGGVFNAIVGSLIELGIATAISLPLGIITAVYMSEVGGRFARVVRTVVDAMTALPDILAGLFIYAILILALGFGRSGFAAAAALTVMMLPIIARASDVGLRVVPGGLREASLALGAPQWRTVRRVIIPTAGPSLAQAVILGMARAVGETAPVLICSAPSQFMNANPFVNPMNSLPLYILTGVRSGEPKFIERGFGAGIVLFVLVLILFGTAKFLGRSRVARR
jgi:phosphate transport system permease protein